MTVISIGAANTLNAENDTFSNRVEMLLAMRGCSKAWLSAELGITRQALNHVLKHGKKPKFVSELALVFNVSPKWLETGKGKPQQTPGELLTTISLYEFQSVLKENGIKNISCIEKILLKTENEHQHFAILFQKYPSMSTKFEENSILIFDENLAPQNGTYVLAKVGKVGVVFRQFFIENKVIILKPSDNAFDIIKCERCDILGALIETRIKF